MFKKPDPQAPEEKKGDRRLMETCKTANEQIQLSTKNFAAELDDKRNKDREEIRLNEKETKLLERRTNIIIQQMEEFLHSAVRNITRDARNIYEDVVGRLEQ
jgi:hypothetical protein